MRLTAASSELKSVTKDRKRWRNQLKYDQGVEYEAKVHGILESFVFRLQNNTADCAFILCIVCRSPFIVQSHLIFIHRHSVVFGRLLLLSLSVSVYLFSLFLIVVDLNTNIFALSTSLLNFFRNCTIGKCSTIMRDRVLMHIYVLNCTVSRLKVIGSTILIVLHVYFFSPLSHWIRVSYSLNLNLIEVHFLFCISWFCECRQFIARYYVRYDRFFVSNEVFFFPPDK